MKAKSYILIVFAICLFSACGNRPSSALSEKKMENILYDLYIAEAEIRQNPSEFNRDTLLKQQLLEKVFEKHHISKAKFDTSLVWYAANLEKYNKINERLIVRYDAGIASLQKQLQAEAAEAERLKVTDTTFIYPSETIILYPAYKNNIFSFILDDNIQLNKLKRYYIEFQTIGATSSVQPVFTFNIQCADTTYVYQDTITENSFYKKDHYLPLKKRVQKIYGSFYIPEEIKNPVFFNNFNITQRKVRTQEETEKQNTNE